MREQLCGRFSSRSDRDALRMAGGSVEPARLPCDRVLYGRDVDDFVRLLLAFAGLDGSVLISFVGSQ